MIVKETFEVAGRFARSGVRAWLIGGNAVELVVDRDLRGHDDLDFFVAARHAARAVRVLQQLGFRHAHGSLQAGDVFYEREGLLVDLVPIRDDRDPPCTLGQLHALVLPSGFLAPHVVDHPEGQVVTSRPEMHLRMKALVADFFGVAPRSKDRTDMDALAALLRGVPAAGADSA